MSENNERTKTSRPDRVIEVLSDDESDSATPQQSFMGVRRHSVIEVLSDESDDEVEFVAETSATPATNEVEITGQNDLPQIPTEISYPGGPPVAERPARAPRPRLARPTRRITRRRHNPPNEGDMPFVDFHGPGGENGLPFFIRDSVPEMLLQQQRALFRILHPFGQNDNVSNTIMERLARDDEAALDRKIENENIHNRKMLRQKEKIATEETDGYTNSISADHTLMCELCGVELGEGIPADFKPGPRYDDNLVEYAGKFRVNAPWFCIRQCSEADMDLSKRAFAAKCGHVFCGRCIKNIGSRAPGRRSKKKKEELTILNPQISAPRKCPAKDCGIMFTKSKKTFTELFI